MKELKEVLNPSDIKKIMNSVKQNKDLPYLFRMVSYLGQYNLLDKNIFAGYNLLFLSVIYMNFPLFEYLVGTYDIENADPISDRQEKMSKYIIQRHNTPMFLYYLIETRKEYKRGLNYLTLYAIENKKNNWVQWLLDLNPNEKYIHNNKTLLGAAVINKNREAIHILREYGYDPNVKNEQKETPLQIAINMNNVELVKQLLLFSDIQISEKMLETPNKTIRKLLGNHIQDALIRRTKHKDKDLRITLQKSRLRHKLGFYDFVEEFS